MTSFTLFQIGPKFEFGDAVLADVPQHCTRGHSWNFGFSLIGVKLDLSSLGLTDGEEQFCFQCLRDRLREHCGRVKDGVK